MLETATIDLDKLLNGKVVKRGGDKTPFYQYKLDFILNKLKVPKELQFQFKKQLFHHFKDAKLIYTTQIREQFHIFFKQNDLKSDDQKYTQYFKKEQQEFKDATNVQLQMERLFKRDPRIVHENANKNSKVFNTMRDLQAGTACRAIGLQMLPDIVAKAHLRGDIHWHDLDYSPVTTETNCSLVDFKNMLAHGFKIGNAYVETPKSINTAVAQIAQIIANVASLQYGGISFNRADEVLEPYAKKNYRKHLKQAKEWVAPDKQRDFAVKYTKKDIYDAMQSLEYEINTLFSSQGQTPFTTVNFGLGTSWIEREIQKDILKIRIKGLGKERRTAVFPKLIYVLKKGLNFYPKDPNYDIKKLAIKCSTLRMYPDILMYDKICQITGNYKAPMGCRSFLQKWTNKDGKEENDGRMNLGVVTVNLPRIAMLAHGNKGLFWKIFYERMGTCHRALKYRTHRVCQAKPENAPLLYEYGGFGKRLKPGDNVRQLFDHYRATVSLGYIGLYEVGTTFGGPNWEHNKKVKAFTVDIVRRMHNLCHKWSLESGYHYSLYSTPAESLTDTFCRDDLKKFGKVKDITDKQYYTNSFHYDVRKQPTPFEKLSFEQDYPPYAAGGFIHYCEYPNLKMNPAALEAVWNWAYDHVGYLGTNTSIDKCFKCGFKGDFKATSKGFVCPQCGNSDPRYCDVVKRLCGYLGNPQARPIVHGRLMEIASRKKNMSTGMIQNVAKYEKDKQSDSRLV
ncbi:anaerobic ribonucleoside-triphosphate reductase [uncultured bacterium]|uniref:Anaerobic ribonucleoside-triphosphate reductase n=1 Tax=Acetilactobacillus jinshanensis TaxID=1720083 RepID=A0A4P6ZKC1_9LACO|nr:anaerobic ribonucleoside-triphosphate reductase [Acetilactobacillus jinshanensis]QBP18108.1 anaerobic ribonucleoside-triphosphate reductase [Acetilactobacillus jinshanensis]URL61902.1 anaerobic ribonucleoside-triphosphate reductase [uncultured bacterium]